MRRLLIPWLLLASSAAGQQLSATYQQLLHPAIARQSVVENLEFDWRGLHFTLARGTIALAAPVNGQVFAAAFIGEGRLEVEAPNPIERQQMAWMRGKPASSPGLDETFTQAVFHFANGDAFLAALGSQARLVPAAGNSPLSALIEQRSRLIGAEGRSTLALILAAPGTPLLLAELKTGDGKWIEADYQPRALEPLSVSTFAQNPITGFAVFHDVWTQFRPAAAPPQPAPARLDDYDLSMAIPDNLDMSVAAAFNLRAGAPQRGALLSLDSNLRVTAAATAAGQPIAWIQPADPGAIPAPFYRGGWLYLEFPQTLAAQSTLAIRLQYHGKQVVQKVGPGNFFARSEGWYPQNPYGPVFQRANFALHFKVNHNYTVVATGARVGNRREGNFQLSDWQSESPLTVAGFALGDYSEFSSPVALADGQVIALQVFANNQPDDMFAALNRDDSPLPLGILDAKLLAPRAIAQTAAALRFFSTYFGPYPYTRLSLTTIPASYGQSWPSLLYLSNLSFVDATQLHLLGIPPSVSSLLTDSFRAHETSHQWWGHRVSWTSYHDQWLSEGFANASALLFQERFAGHAAALDTLREWRQALLEKNRFGHVPDQDGALWLGERLASSLDPSGYEAATYDKGGYALYMLREMMLGDAQSANPDAAFMAMMRDFTATFANRDASSADFQAIAEKHMLPAMDLDHNGKLDWFFNQYVYGTGVAHLHFEARISGPQVAITVENPEHWRGLLPIYAFRDGQHYLRGQLAIDQDQVSQNITLPFTPTKVEANHYLDMLVEVKQ